MTFVMRAWLLIIGLVFIGSAHAQTTSFESMMNGIIKGTPGITNVAISSGVRSTASGSVAVAVDGFTIPVATTVAADVGFGAIAAGGAKVALRAVPYVGAALVIGDIASKISSSGIKPCPPPDFFCKPSIPPGAVYQYQMTGGAGTTQWNENPAAACSNYVSMRNQTPQPNGDMVPYLDKGITGSGDTVYCNLPSIDYVGASGFHWTYTDHVVLESVRLWCSGAGVVIAAGGTCPGATGPATGTMVPATTSDINGQLSAAANADHDWGVKMKAEMDALTQANPGLEPVIDVKTAPLTLTAPPVTSQPQTVSTRTIPNADGTTSTETVTKTTTVTAVQGSPSTVNSPNISYQPKTTTTTTTVNNNTNVTTTTSTTTNNSPIIVNSPQTKLDLPTDYNREATQLKIFNILNGDNMPTAAITGGDAAASSVDAQEKTNLAAAGQVSDTGLGLSNWFPKIPTAQCVNPQVPNPISGALVAVPICDSVNTFSLFISGVISVFCLYGCVREVSSAIKS